MQKEKREHFIMMILAPLMVVLVGIVCMLLLCGNCGQEQPNFTKESEVSSAIV